MIYIEKEDLVAYAFERFIDESTQDFIPTLDKLETDNIALMKNYLKWRYDVALIFDETSPVKHELLKRILSKLMLYDAVRRNAARKVPEDYKEEWNWAMKMLEDLNTGKFTIDDLPPKDDGDGDGTSSDSIWGNNRNDNFYI